MQVEWVSNELYKNHSLLKIPCKNKPAAPEIDYCSLHSTIFLLFITYKVKANSNIRVQKLMENCLHWRARAANSAANSVVTGSRPCSISFLTCRKNWYLKSNQNQIKENRIKEKKLMKSTRKKRNIKHFTHMNSWNI